MITQRQHLEETANVLEKMIVRTNNSTVFPMKVKRAIVGPLVDKVKELRQRALLADLDTKQGRLM